MTLHPMPHATLRRTTAALAALTSALLAMVLVATGLATTADAAAGAKKKRHVRVSTWAPADQATIKPGVQMYTGGAQCTGNFVFTDNRGNVYVGYSAHCAGTGAATDTDGCLADSLPLGTRVTFTRGGSLLSGGTRVGAGRLVYSSWEAMDRVRTTDVATCAYNDFALVKVDAADRGKVNPSIPFWGGPTGIDTDGTTAGERVYSYGNSSLRFGVELLSPKTGFSLGDAAADGGWSHPLYTLTPGVPGDSGSAFVDGDGEAVGTLSTLGLAPLPASNNIGDLARELAFAQQHSGISGLRLTRGTEPFSPLL